MSVDSASSVDNSAWWITLLIGVLPIGGSFVAARVGAKQTEGATEQRERAAAREEWFRRLQWATDLTLKDDPRSQVTGLAVLSALALSPLASPPDLDLLSSLNSNAHLNEVEGDFDNHVDDTDFVADDEEDGEAAGEEHHDDDR